MIGRRHSALEAPLAAHLAMRHLAVCTSWNSAVNSSFMTLCGLQQSPFSVAQIAQEVTSFLNPPTAPSERLPGRQTGSVEWRHARGELGSGEPTWRGWVSFIASASGCCCRCRCRYYAWVPSLPTIIQIQIVCNWSSRAAGVDSECIQHCCSVVLISNSSPRVVKCGRKMKPHKQVTKD